MRLAGTVNNNNSDVNRIKAQVRRIKSDYIECKHLTSNYTVKAFITKEMKFEIGQVVLLEFRRNAGGGGYIVIDDLMEVIKAEVLEAQHIINNGMMYTSLILRNPDTNQRMHSLVPNTDKLFSNTSIVITGDVVTLRINNGSLFSLEY